MKRFFPLVLVFFFGMIFWGGDAVFAETGTTPDGFRYSLVDTPSGYKYELTIIGYDPEKLAPNAVLPTTINGKEVTKIEDGAFQNCAILKTMTMGSGGSDRLWEIGEYAFSGCTNLEKISFADSIDTVGAYAFAGCTSLREVDFSRKIAKIGGYAFYNCVCLGAGADEIDLKGTSAIYDYAFAGCTGLKSIGGSRSDIVRLGKGAFSGCTSLEQATLSNNIYEISESAFEGCVNLKRVQLNDVTGQMYTDFNLEEIGRRAFAGCIKLETFFSKGVTRIREEAFQDCLALQDLDFIDERAAVTVEKGAFRNCDSLKDVSLYFRKIVPENVFYDCNGLETVEIHAEDLEYAAEKIEAKAFAACPSLRKIKIPGTVDEISSDALQGSESVVVYGDTNTVAEKFALASGYSFLPSGDEGGGSMSAGTSTSGNTELVYNGVTYQGSVMFDTVWYRMPSGPIPGNSTANLYDVGVVMAGNAKTKTLKVYSSRTGIATVHGLANGNYRITGVSPGTCYIMLEVWDNGKMLNHYSVQIQVVDGISPYGQAGRLRSYFN